MTNKVIKKACCLSEKRTISSSYETEVHKIDTITLYSEIVKKSLSTKMVVEISRHEASLSKAVHQNLVAAKCESRVIIGLSRVVKSLSKIPDQGLFCVMAPPIEGDTATHMLEVLLQAYCYENDIYLIMVSIHSR